MNEQVKLRPDRPKDAGLHDIEANRPGQVLHRVPSRERAGSGLRPQEDQGTPIENQIFDMADQKQRDKCLREVEIMKKLSHPHIIQFIDSFIHNNELIIVTEWAERGDLKKLIKDKESDDLQFD